MKQKWFLVPIRVLAGIGLGIAIATLFHWDLSLKINWDAINAIATVIAAAATGFAAYVGLRAVDNWRQGNLHKGAVESILAFESTANDFKISLQNLELHLIRGIHDKEPTSEETKQNETLHTNLARVARQHESEYERLRKHLLFYVPDEEESLFTANQIYRSFDGLCLGPRSDKRFQHVEVAFYLFLRD